MKETKQKLNAEQIGKEILAYEVAVKEAFKHQQTLLESGYSHPWIDVPVSCGLIRIRLEVR